MNCSAAVAQKPVVIKVGEGDAQVEYHVHRAFLVHYSAYFRGALNGNFKEAIEGCVHLEDVEAGVFEVFLEWLYTQKLPRNMAHIQTAEAEIKVVKLYTLADRLLVPDLERTLIDVVFSDKPSPLYESIFFAFTHLPVGNPLLQLLVDKHCARWEPELDEEKETELRRDLPSDFLLGVMDRFSKVVKELRDNGKELKLDICDYHDHKSDVERQECKEKQDPREQNSEGDDSEESS